ncbi:MAG: hypothetical protein CVU18_07325 [Betaproteobacteria bacterium HGW-Betaproteobacteria-12]|nr:MAG: hypothetical protein CVU18_07325 [Betaproteobacteria bacterium HGW-Betaproteobacteria-12]
MRRLSKTYLRTSDEVLAMASLAPYLLFALVSLGLSACGTTSRTPATSEVPPSGSGDFAVRPQLNLQLASGNYNCAQGVRLKVEREVHEQVNHRIRLAWKGSTYSLDRDPSISGLPRFENAAGGLVWIDLPWKGLLLDAKTNKPLANECQPAGVVAGS